MKQLVKSLLSRYGYVIRKVPPLLAKNPSLRLRFDFNYVMAHLLLAKQSPFVVQVGAYDGSSNDPLCEHIRRLHMRGILIEPQIEAFKALKQTYSDQPQLTLAHAAVAHEDGTQTLYKIDPKTVGMPSWAPQTATFCKEVLLRHAHVIPNIDKHIVTELVRSVTFNTLFREHSVEAVDVLMIDTEGYDYEVLKLFPFERFTPHLIRYEHIHLSPADWEASLQLLSNKGYMLFVPELAGSDYMDTVAYLPS